MTHDRQKPSAAQFSGLKRQVAGPPVRCCAIVSSPSDFLSTAGQRIWQVLDTESVVQAKTAAGSGTTSLAS